MMFSAGEQTVSEQKKLQSPKPKQSRVSSADAKVFTRSCRRTLKRKPDPNSPDSWADILSCNLYEIACDDESSLNLRLQAIKTAIDLCGGESIDMKVKREDSEARSGKMSLRPLPEEEALSDEELDTQIAELQARLGSIPEAGS
jgi:hypothetical protein